MRPASSGRRHQLRNRQVEVKELLNAMHIVELSATARSTAIRELVDAIKWADESVSPEDVVQAIEDREAAAQTIVDKGLALPHAIIKWTGDFCVVLGRSRSGVDYVATGEKLHLIVLLVVGKGGSRMHLQLLATLADLLNDEELRQDLVQASHVRNIKQLLVERAGRQQQKRRRLVEIPRRSMIVTRHAVSLAESLPAQALLLAMDSGQSVPWDPLRFWPGRLLIITSQHGDDVVVERADTHLFDIPDVSLSRMDRSNLGLLLAAANGLVDHERDVVCITGPRGQALDSISVTKPAAHFRAVFPEQGGHATKVTPPAVILRVLSLAIELASEGREAHPIGVMFVIGDTRQVIRHTQQLVLNPFHGFSRRLRNILDPSLAETVKEFALLDGAFIVEADGAIRSAGTYLIPKCHVRDLPGGLGARHQAAAAIPRKRGRSLSPSASPRERSRCFKTASSSSRWSGPH